MDECDRCFNGNVTQGNTADTSADGRQRQHARTRATTQDQTAGGGNLTGAGSGRRRRAEPGRLELQRDGPGRGRNRDDQPEQHLRTGRLLLQPLLQRRRNPGQHGHHDGQRHERQLDHAGRTPRASRQAAAASLLPSRRLRRRRSCTSRRSTTSPLRASRRRPRRPRRARRPSRRRTRSPRSPSADKKSKKVQEQVDSARSMSTMSTRKKTRGSDVYRVAHGRAGPRGGRMPAAGPAVGDEEAPRPRKGRLAGSRPALRCGPLGLRLGRRRIVRRRCSPRSS